MKRMNVVVVGLLLATGAAAAQERPQSNVSPEAQLQQRRFQFKLVETVLENAVHQGASEVAARAQGVMPMGMLFIGMAKANGFPLEGFGVVFDVEIPEIRESAVLLNQFPRPGVTPAPQPVSNATARATGVVPDDPMSRSPVTGDPFLADPNRFYRDVITEKLIDVMLDYSKTLEIPSGECLSVVARGEEEPIPSRLYDDSRTLILRITGHDLALFHSGEITRAEARKRVSRSDF